MSARISHAANPRGQADLIVVLQHGIYKFKDVPFIVGGTLLDEFICKTRDYMHNAPIIKGKAFPSICGIIPIRTSHRRKSITSPELGGGLSLTQQLPATRPIWRSIFWQKVEFCR
jgi:hypothetical protein